MLSQKRPTRAWLFAVAPIMPLLIFLFAFFVIPVAMLLSLSFLGINGGVDLDQYARLFNTPVYAQVLVITFKISAATTIVALIAAYPVSYLLATTSSRNRNWLILLVLMPFWTSFLVRAFAWIILLGRNGAVNNFLVAAGITDAPIALIYNLTGVLIGMTHGMIPLAIVTMLPVMQNIESRLLPAAHTLGATPTRAFLRVYLPLSLPGVAAAGLLVFITSLGFFIVPALLGGARDTMIAQLIISAIQDLLNWRFAGALSLMLLIASCVIFYLYDKAVGLSTLSGAAAGSLRERGSARSHLTRLFARLGNLVVEGLDRAVSTSNRVFAALQPSIRDRRRSTRGRRVLGVFVGVVIGFLLLPTFFVVPVSFTAGEFVRFPPTDFSLRWYETYLSSNVWVSATIRSLLVALATALLATLLGTAAAFVLARGRAPGGSLLLALVLAPLILPRMIIAVALYYLFARIGLVGTSTGLVIGHTVLAVPYVVITVMAVLRTYDERLDQAAWTLGASKLQTLRYVTLPQIREGILAGALFAFVTSFDDLTIALFISGGSTSTLPRQMWNDLLLQVNPTLAAVSTVMLLFITVVILVAERLRRRASSSAPEGNRG